MSTTPLLVFAKTPLAGQVKTRLHSHCTPEQAAKIAELLLRGTLNTACKHWPGNVILVVWPNAHVQFVEDLAEEFEINSVSQGTGDLGEKMADGAKRFGYPVAIVGSDTPHMPAEVLIQTHTLLENRQRVIGPSTDGGYYLIGLIEEEPALFENIEWGSSSVLGATLGRAKFEQLPAMTDVDHWQDLLEVSMQLPELRAYLFKQGLIDAV